MITTSEYADLSALDIAHHVRHGNVTAVDVVGAALARIAEVDDDIRAFTVVWAERAARRSVENLAEAGLITLAEGPDLSLVDPAPAWTALRAGARSSADGSRIMTTNEERLRDCFHRAELVLTPTTPHPPHGHDGPGARMSVALTWAFNLSGHPALSLPAGITAQGAPVGLQLVARRHEERQLLDVADRATRLGTVPRSLGWRRPRRSRRQGLSSGPSRIAARCRSPRARPDQGVVAQ
ncbi:amidase family protein [Streptomyces sp. NPDC001292]|uniref:amidase family protein n=1 Tax=Streptomyces sp. NPDC001292 TaxID=3364558 RepID=UPI0036B6D3F8